MVLHVLPSVFATEPGSAAEALIGCSMLFQKTQEGTLREASR